MVIRVIPAHSEGILSGYEVAKSMTTSEGEREATTPSPYEK
eukprot:COSAG02_NODE_3879_length_6094_cov_3.714262_3_plen_40_part_01